MKELGPHSRYLVVWVALRGRTTISDVNNDTGMTLLTILQILPELVDKGFVERDSDTLHPGEKAPERH